LIEDGWRPAAPYSAEERTEYRHPEKGGRVFIDRDWDEFWEDDPIFACLQHDMQIDAEELIRLLRADD
jgi:hypothetical protein